MAAGIDPTPGNRPADGAAADSQGPSPPQIFISYASADLHTAESVCAALERENLRCWIAPRDVTPGEFYAAEIVRALDSARLVVLVLSRHAADSAHVFREVERASSRKHPILAFRLDQSALPAGLEYFLNTSQWLDARSKGVRHALPDLVRAVKATLAKPSSPPPSVNVRTIGADRTRKPTQTAVIVAMVLVAVVLIVAFGVLRDRRTEISAPSASTNAPVAESRHQKAIAVLPFADMSPGKDQAYLADGISEEILNLLSESSSLRVIARTSSFSFRDTNLDVPAIAGKLNVTHILEGSVRKSGERIRVTAQLIDTSTASQVWSETYDRHQRDFLDLQSDIAKSVASALQVALDTGGHSQRGKSTNAEAHELYLQGLHAWNREGPGDVSLARTYFEQAVAIDPAHADAWAGLAGVYRVLTYDRVIDKRAGLALQRDAVEKALALAPDFALAHIRASQYYWDSGDEPTAERHFNQAAKLAPADPQVLRNTASIALDENDIAKAVEFQERAVGIDPLSARSRTVLAELLLATDRYSEAEEQLSKALELSPGSLDLNADLCRAWILQSRFEDARSAAGRAPPGPKRDQCLALLDYSTGKFAEADAALKRLTSTPITSGPYADIELYVAEVYARRGSSDEAFQWLERAKHRAMTNHGSEPGWGTRMRLRTSPFLKTLHADARWDKLVNNPWRA